MTESFYNIPSSLYLARSHFPKHRKHCSRNKRTHRIEQKIVNVPHARRYERLMPFVARTVEHCDRHSAPKRRAGNRLGETVPERPYRKEGHHEISAAMEEDIRNRRDDFGPLPGGDPKHETHVKK